MKHLTTIGLCLGMLLMSSVTFAQGSFNWPTDPTAEISAKERYMRLTDAKKNGDLVEAYSSIRWLWANTPELSTNLYISATQVLEEMIDIEKDAARKKALQDSAMMAYDLRMKYFGDEVEVLNRKLFKAYQYYGNRPEKMEGMVNNFARLFELGEANEIRDYHALFYMDALRRHKKANNPALTDEEILKIHEMLSNHLENKIPNATGKEKAQLEEWKNQIDGILADMITIDCDFVQSNLGPKYMSDPSDIELGKKIIALSINLGCTDTDIFNKAAEEVSKVEPQKGLLKVLAQRALRDDRFDEAIKIFEQVIEMSEDNVEQAEITARIADVYNNRGQKGRARDLYLKAVQIDPSAKEAYSKIGDMIMNSYDQCKREVSRVEDRAIFIAAHEMYRMAGNSQRMAQAKAQFPTAEMIFTEGKEVGTDVKVGCWIQTTVKIQRAE